MLTVLTLELSRVTLWKTLLNVSMADAMAAASAAATSVSGSRLHTLPVHSSPAV